MAHIHTAKAAAEALDITGLSHPIADRVALRGILHALLALHEQNEPTVVNPPTNPASRRTTTKKVDK